MRQFFAGGGFKLFTVCPGKSAVFCEPAFLCCFCHRHSIWDQSTCHKKPLIYNIIMKGIAGFLFELPHQVILAYIIFCRKSFHRKVFLQVMVNILKNVGNLRVKGVGFFIKNVLLFQKDTVQINHKLKKKWLCQDFPSIFIGFCGIFQFKQDVFHLFLKSRVQTYQIIASVICFLEAFQQFLPGNIVLDPENETFIWNRRINLRAVDGMAVYQKNVPWFQLISFSFYMIGSFAGDEDNYLVKIMIMVREFLSGLVFKMKKSELFVQVSCFSVW